MLKLLITGALIYFVYRFFIAQPALGDHSANHSHQDNHNQQQTPSHDDEYIDYEEVD